MLTNPSAQGRAYLMDFKDWVYLSEKDSKLFQKKK